MSGSSLIKLVLVWLFICGLSDFDGQLSTLGTLSVAILCYVYSKWQKRRTLVELTDERKEQIEKIMKEPSPLEVTDYEEKIRRNLVLSSSAAIVFTSLGLQLSPRSRFLGGIQFNNITSELVYMNLLAVVIYESIHYFWLVKNSFQLWRVRLTGTKHEEHRGSSGMIAGMGNDPKDNRGKQENSNFYIWMLENQRQFLSGVENNKNQWEQIEDWVKGLDDQSTPGTTASVISDRFNNLVNVIDNQQKTIENIRVSASMHRFDNWYHSLVRSQSWRWVILDVLIPVVLSVSAIGLIGYELYIMDSSLDNKELTTEVPSYTCTVEVTK